MPIHHRPHFEPRRERERERDSRERDRAFGRRDEDDERGAWMSRDPFDPREREFPRDRFERFEDWERPRQYGGGAGVGPRGLPNRAGGGWHEHGASFGHEVGEGSWGGLRGQGRYAGRGPKGYQRSDARIEEEICERLTAAADIDASELEVLVQSGEVTLQGSVPDRSMKRAAEDCVEEVSGVQQVHNRLRVEARPDEGERSADRFAATGSEGQRSSAGRKAH